MKRFLGFTLAEVLITLGIIGVVAALTLPSLISKYQKHVYYTQFRKAATIIENAINAYNFDYSCGSYQYGYYDNLCYVSEDWGEAEKSLADKFGEYIKVLTWINNDNYKEVCAGYDRLGPAFAYDGSDRDGGRYGSSSICSNDFGVNYKDGYGFITTDGMLMQFSIDGGYAGGSFVDTNGPDKGPNTFGRDMFWFYVDTLPSNERWGHLEDNSCLLYGVTDDCGARLLLEGKMNY